MQQLFDKQEFQKVQDHFCTLTGLYAYCVDDRGRNITEMSGNKEGVEILRKNIPEEEFYQIFKRVSGSGLEDMVVERTVYDNIRLAAVSVRESGVQGNCFLICCVLNEPVKGDCLKMPGQGMDPDTFYEALDLIADLEHKMLAVASRIALKEDTKVQPGIAGFKAQIASGAAKAVADMVRLSGTEGSFKNLGSKILDIAVKYLNVSGGKLFRVLEDGTHVSILGSACKDGGICEAPLEKERFSSDLLTGSRPLWVKC